VAVDWKTLYQTAKAWCPFPKVSGQLQKEPDSVQPAVIVDPTIQLSTLP
jgi:hypothetical protein